MAKYIKYGLEEINYLTLKDPVLGLYIKKTGLIKREIEDDLFKSLVDSIVGQQISTKAAATIREKIETLVGNITPASINQVDDLLLKSCGLSFRKTSYLKGIARSFIENNDLYNNLSNESNEVIEEVLIKLKGIGKWTVEMLLIHTFNRKDILSFLDLGIKRGLMKLHSLDNITKEDELYYNKLYSPYGNVASIYLWEKSKEK